MLVEIGIQDVNGTYILGDRGTVLATLPGFNASASDPATLTVTRETGGDSNLFLYSISGGGLSSAVSGVVTAPAGITTSTPVYFGLMSFATRSGQEDEESNLLFTPAD